MSMNESDTRAKLIDPALHARGWTEDLIKREETAGEIIIDEGNRQRRLKGRTDYTLRIKVNKAPQPVAVALIEAKAAGKAPDHGLEQGKQYAEAKLLNVPFVFSTNGHLFVEHDRFTKRTSDRRPMEQFPTPDELRERYEQWAGFNLEDKAAEPLLIPYVGGEASRRYYQDAAIRAVLEKLARGEKRALLSLATGSGKTHIAVHLLKRLADAKKVRKALFICDRDELRTQASAQLQNIFKTDATVVTSRNPQTNARILIATYQTLGIDSNKSDASFLIKHYRENYFTHIIIDECHRSAWNKWSLVLKRNPDAVQIGLTATPRQIHLTEENAEALRDKRISADNIRHFGEPVYEYDMSQGIEDGYLAACEIIKRDILINFQKKLERRTGIKAKDLRGKKLTNANTGEKISEEQLRKLYKAASFERALKMPERLKAMTGDLFRQLLATGGAEQKTIIFCASDSHADAVASAMNNLYADWCIENGKSPLEHYAFKCTSASNGNDFLPDFRASSRHHFVATTVDLLTTGVDVPAVRNIVFFKYVSSPIAFYQMVGRGTRIDLVTDKLMFRVYDYTDATRLFGEEFKSKLHLAPTDRPQPIKQIEQKTVTQVEGLEFHVTDAGRFMLAKTEGKDALITLEEYRQRVATRLVEQAKTLEEFRGHWIVPDKRRVILDDLMSAGVPPKALQILEEMTDYDLYDVLAEVGYGMSPHTRLERAEAFKYKHADWLQKMPRATAKTLQAIAEQFARAGTEGLESNQLLQAPEVKRAGGLNALKALERPAREVLNETKERIFSA